MGLETGADQAVRDALSGFVGLLMGDVEVSMSRQHVRFGDGPSDLRFGPFRDVTTVTGIGVFQNNRRMITEPFDEPVKVAAGQTLDLTVDLSVTS